MRILVTGASGYVGSRLVTALLADGHDVLAASRDSDGLARFGWFSEITAIALDAADPASVAAAFDAAGPVDLVYYLLHGIGQPDFRAADNRAAANVAVAAKAAGVNRIVYLGGFVPGDRAELSDHLAGRAEVADALEIDGGPEVVWLGAAVIIGAGSTSFELIRYAGDRFWLIPMPKWAGNRIDPISIRDVIYYLVAAADYGLVPAGGYDICGPQTTTYRGLLAAYSRARGTLRAEVPVRGIDTGLISRVAALFVPIPSGLAADLAQSLDHPMTTTAQLLGDKVPDPPGGLLGIDAAIALALSSRRPRPVNALADVHHLADSDPGWAGGDALALARLSGQVAPSLGWPARRLARALPGPIAGAIRTAADVLAPSATDRSWP